MVTFDFSVKDKYRTEEFFKYDMSILGIGTIFLRPYGRTRNTGTIKKKFMRMGAKM